MQYFRPGQQFFVGDCMPFVHENVFHLFYLLDENHHASLGGQGGHQWAHASSRDLVRWDHHPLALAIEQEWERSICTGSVFFQAGKYHAFFATRMKDWTQHLGHAVSDDCITFRKVEPNPFASAPPGYSATDLRDPFVWKCEDGTFEMLVTARLAPYELADRGGCLLSYTSADLQKWTVGEPMLIPGGTRGMGSTPECPDLFEWNGWHYLLFGLGLQTHYRMSHSARGPWLRPGNDMLDNGMNAVMKSAAFGGRRIAVGWLGSRENNRDEGQRLWGGRTVFRELVQNDDGSLGTRFVREMVRLGEHIEMPAFRALTPGVSRSADAIAMQSSLAAPQRGDAVGALLGLPIEYHLQCTIELPNGPGTGLMPAESRPATTRSDLIGFAPASFGMAIRGTGDFVDGYELRFNLHRRTISLRGQTIDMPDPTGTTYHIELVVRADLLDVCINGRTCLIDECHELKGNQLFFFCEDGAVRFSELQFHKLDSNG